VPRELHQKEMDIFGAPPQQQQPRERERKRAGRGKGKQPATSGSVVVKSAFEPINERPHHQIRQDAATSTTDLAAQEGSAGLGGDGSEVPRVLKAQINALAKMLSALACLLLSVCPVVHCIVMMEPNFVCSHAKRAFFSSCWCRRNLPPPSFLLLFFPST
jgi:hypothetical protein